MKNKLAKVVSKLQELSEFAQGSHEQPEKEDFREIASMAGCIIYDLLDGLSDDEKEEIYELSKDYNHEAN